MTATDNIKAYLEWHDGNIGGDMAVTRGFSISDLRELVDENDRLREERDRMAWFISSEGYRRCDIAACNCPYWHGGNASQRLAEIGDELGELTNGKTILMAVADLLAENERLREQLDKACSVLQAALTQDTDE